MIRSVIVAGFVRKDEVVVAGLTAMGKAFSTDFAPLDIETMPGFVSSPEVGERMTRLNFHFWTRSRSGFRQSNPRMRRKRQR